MSEKLVDYQGRKVEREGFRVFVFGLNGANKLVNSYDEFEAALEQGWVSTRDELPANKEMVQVDLAKITDLATQKGRNTKRG